MTLVASTAGARAAARKLDPPKMGFAPATIALLLAACSTAAPTLPALPACGETPAEVLACARAREDAVASMRARFKATMQRDGESNATTGVLVVSKPDRFRLRLMLPFGLTVFDGVKNGTTLQMSLPLQGGTVQPGNGVPTPFLAADLEEAFLRGSYAFPGTCEAAREEEGDAVVVRCHDADGALRRVLHLDPTRATIRDEISYEAGAVRMTLRYDDYRPIAPGIVMPYSIRLGQPTRRITLAIEIERYEINPSLPDALFQPVTG